MLQLLLGSALAGFPHAAAAAACHCFRERAFDPARPAAADPYVLATAQNSLLAAAFGTEKKAIVRAKMTGTANDDLWVAHFVAQQTGHRVSDLLDARAKGPSWAVALESSGVSRERLAGLLERPGSALVTDADFAATAVQRSLAQRLGADPETLAALRRSGATSAEMVTAAFLARLTGRPADQLRQEVVEGRTTWGTLLAAVGVEPAAVEEKLRSLLR